MLGAQLVLERRDPLGVAVSTLEPGLGAEGRRVEELAGRSELEEQRDAPDARFGERVAPRLAARCGLVGEEAHPDECGEVAGERRGRKVLA